MKKGNYWAKLIINKSRTVLSFIWSIYFVMGGLTIQPMITKWALEQADRQQSQIEAWLFSITPLVSAATIVLFVVWFSSISLNPWFKYTSNEIVRLKQQKAKFPKTLKWLMWEVKLG